MATGTERNQVALTTMSKFTIVIGNKNYSSWSLRPWLWMKHQGLDFDEVNVSLFSDSMEAQIRPYFSNNKVPVLIHEGQEIWDSLAILEYLSALPSIQSQLMDTKATAVMRSLCAEMHSSFVSLRSELPMNCRREPSPLLLSDNCLADCERIQSLWNYASGFSDGRDHWLFGSFSIADAMFAPVVLRFHRYCVPLNDYASTYVKHMLQHPAMIDWIESGCAETQVIEQEER